MADAKPQTLAGKLAIVSGSSKGLGAAIALELASRGALVATNYPHADLQAEAETVLTQIRALNATHSQDVFAVEADLSTTKGPTELVAKVLQQSKRDKIDILINNAGVAIMTPFKAVTLEEWDKHINLNARGTFLLTQAVLPYLSKGSRIVNLSSSGARQPYMASSVYNGTKAMIESFTRCWAAEFGREYQCTVNAIAPGAQNTEGFRAVPDEFRASLEPMLAATPLAHRVGEPEEVAYAAAFFCEERARWMTGVVLSVNGGTLMI